MCVTTRHGTFEPQLIGKHERRFTGFDDMIVAMYARGLSVREIQKFLAELYAVDVSPHLISRVTDVVGKSHRLAHGNSDTPRQPRLDLGVTVSCVVIGNAVSIQLRWHRLVDLAQERQELLVVVAQLATGQHCTR